MTEPQKHPFQAEVSQVLHLVVHSLYSNKEIFLRELVSNASDAIDKLRFRALSEPNLLGDERLGIRLLPDEAAGTLTIADNGVGMSEREMVENLGTIARSGTREFVENMKQAAAAKQAGQSQLIGQFGVGFYSAFLVADRVEVISRAAGSEQAHIWSSDAGDSFTIGPAERAERGTTIVLHLKEDQKQYAKAFTLREVIRKHSDYVGHPIELVTKDKDGEEKDEVINQASALWQRPSSEVTAEQYNEFYKHLAHAWEDPLAHKHFHIEGTLLFSGIVFLPKSPTRELFDPRLEHGVRLHVRRVLAMENCEELLPKWLRFVSGVVDSEDLPLNVSRETLQDSKIVRTIKKQLTSQILAMLEDLAKERPDDYRTFWAAFGPVFKEGLHFEPELAERLAPLLRFHSTHEKGAWTTLADYVARMPEGQADIYYVEGASEDILAQSPQLEQLKKRGYEVLLLVDAVDPFAIENLREFGGKKLVDAMKEKLSFGNDEPAEPEGDSLTERFQSVLGNRVSSVRNSSRLDTSPVCLVTAEGGLPPHVMAMLRAQKMDAPPEKRILELNPEHDVVKNLRKMLLLRPDAPELNEWIEVLHDQALIAEGSPVADPVQLARRLTALLTQASARALD
jgi:molecular chaperone HtpG